MQAVRPDSGPIHAKELVALTTGQIGATPLELTDDVLDDVVRWRLVGRLEEIASERDRAYAAEDFERTEAMIPMRNQFRNGEAA